MSSVVDCYAGRFALDDSHDHGAGQLCLPQSPAVDLKPIINGNQTSATYFLLLLFIAVVL